MTCGSASCLMTRTSPNNETAARQAAGVRLAPRSPGRTEDAATAAAYGGGMGDPFDGVFGHRRGRKGRNTDRDADDVMSVARRFVAYLNSPNSIVPDDVPPVEALVREARRRG